VRAVLDFYGGKYYADPTWHTPSPFFASALDYPESLAEKIFEGPQVSAAIPSAGADEVSARDAWLSNAFKSGKHLSLIAKGVNYELIDGSNGFSSKFPPTMFVHGTGDTITPSRISERAQKELSHLGAESHIVLVEGANHMFDMFFTDPEDEAYKTYVVKAFQFLAVKAGLS
jgi:pimeloyl-ACP methyl ester carboxylesterase